MPHSILLFRQKKVSVKQDVEMNKKIKKKNSEVKGQKMD